MFIKRPIKLAYQKVTRGFSDADTWSLDHTIAKFTLPRLKRFKEVNMCHPGNLTEEEWDDILDEMIFAMECSVHQWDDDIIGDLGDEKAKWERCQRGLDYFGEYFRDLWW
jgi:hypothetical protein